MYDNRSLITYTRVSKSTFSGWGVFLNVTRITPGQIIEECVVFPLTNDQPDILSDHRLAWTDESDAMASGNANLYNHSDDPNVEFQFDVDNRIINIVSIKELHRGDELFKKYACPLWWTSA